MSTIDEIMEMAEDIEDKAIGYERGDCAAQAAEIERLKRALSAVDRQLGHDDADDALRDEIDRILKGTK